MSFSTRAIYGKDVVDSRNRPDFFGVLRPLLLGAGLPGSYGNPAIATPDSIAVIPAFAANPALTPGTPGFCAPITINPSGFLDARSLLALLTDISINNSGGGGFGGAYSAGCRTAGAPPFGPILGEQRYTISRPSKLPLPSRNVDAGGLKIHRPPRTPVREQFAGVDPVTSKRPYPSPMS